jgi:hypothetical protein
MEVSVKLPLFIEKSDRRRRVLVFQDDALETSSRMPAPGAD